MSADHEEVNLVATFRAKAGHVDQVRDLIVNYGELVRAEPGNEFFEIYTDRDSHGDFVIVERYRDHAAFEQHLTAEVGKEFNRKLGPLIEGNGSELQFLTRHQ